MRNIVNDAWFKKKKKKVRDVFMNAKTRKKKTPNDPH